MAKDALLNAIDRTVPPDVKMQSVVHPVARDNILQEMNYFLDEVNQQMYLNKETCLDLIADVFS